MILLGHLEFKLPFDNPVLIFSVLLIIILFVPILLNKIKVPHLIGLIIAGAIIGPNGFNILLRNSSITLFGTVGLLYIMFLAGLEIDLVEFKKNSRKSLVFGLLTFGIPMILGTLGSYYILQYSLPTSILLASMFASHTLIAYPILSKFGVTKNRAVNITVGGTMITDTLALLVLAVIAGMATGDVTSSFWIKLIAFVTVFVLIVLFVMPVISRWFFKQFDDNISQFIFVLFIVFISALLAEAAGIEAIIGAFLAGLALNRLIPHTSPLMNRIEFVGNSIFIPFFLIGVGMLIDFKVFFQSLDTIKVAIFMILTATAAKFLAAWITQKTFKFSVAERHIIFGLSNAQAAATLAAVLVGYNIIVNKDEIEAAAQIGKVIQPIRLLSEEVLNGTILMILVTCTIASIVAQKGAQSLALLAQTDNTEEDGYDHIPEKILIPIARLENAEELMNLALTVKSKENKNNVLAVHILDDYKDKDGEKEAKKVLGKAESTASAADVDIQTSLRYDLNVVNGITNFIAENKATDLIMGLHRKKGISDNFLGNLTEGILIKSNATTLIYKSVQPLSTIKRYVVVVPKYAEKEFGFPFWLVKVWNLSKNTGTKLLFYASPTTIQVIKQVNNDHPIECEFKEFDKWSDFLVVSKYVQEDDGLIVVMSRTESVSYDKNMVNVPYYLNNYFKQNNYILIYPKLAGEINSNEINFTNPSISEAVDKIDDLRISLSRVFKRK